MVRERYGDGMTGKGWPGVRRLRRGEDADVVESALGAREGFVFIRFEPDVLIDGVPTAVSRASQRLDDVVHACVSTAQCLEQALAHRLGIIDAVLTNLAREFGVDVVQPDMMDASRGQLEHLHGGGPDHDDVPGVEAQTRLRADHNPFNVGWSSTHSAETRQHSEPEPGTSPHELDGADQMQEGRAPRAV